MFKIERVIVKGSPKTAAMAAIKRQGRGFKQIGSGAFGRVFGSKGHPVVFKIAEYDSEDGYVAWVKELQRCKKQNPLVPVIYGMWIYQNANDNYNPYYVVAMERLTSGYRRAGFLDAVDWFANKAESNIDREDPVAKYFGVERLPNPIIEVIAMIHRAMRRDPWLEYDLHYGNFMMRQGQIVVTDPLC